MCKRKTNESEPLIRHRKAFDVGKTTELRFRGISLGVNCVAAQMPGACRGAREPFTGAEREQENLCHGAKGKSTSAGRTREKVPIHVTGADQLVVVMNLQKCRGAKGLNCP